MKITPLNSHIISTCVALGITVVHNTAQNSSDKFLSYPPDNHNSSNDIYWGSGLANSQTEDVQQSVKADVKINRPDKCTLYKQ